MILEALKITLLGMGGVFAFLVLLICAMHILRFFVEKTSSSKFEKIAVAVALAKIHED